MIIPVAAPVSRRTTAAPGDQPLPSSALAKEPERPKDTAESIAMPRPAAVADTTGTALKAGLVEIWAMGGTLRK